MAMKRLAIISSLLVAGLALDDVQPDRDLFPQVDLAAADEETAEAGRDLRLVEAPVTASRIADVIVNNVLNTLIKVGKTKSLKMPGSLDGTVPFNTDSGPRGIRFQLSNVEYTNLGSISRSKSATIDAQKHRMDGSFKFQGLGINADYQLSIPAVGIAPASSASGKVRAVADTFFVDYTFLTDPNGLPLTVQKWQPRKGKFTYIGDTGLENNQYKSIFESVLKDGTASALNRLVSRQLYNIVVRDIMGKMTLQA